MIINKVAAYYPKTKLHWRKWLIRNHIKKNAVWLIKYRKSAGIPTITWSDAVEEALCFGWIDSVQKKLDENRSIQFFSKRKPKSTWSKINKLKVEKLLEAGAIAQAGLDSIKVAKENGSWEILDSVEELIMPKDLETALKSKPNAMGFFMHFSKSIRKGMLQWIVMARRQETRQKRILEIAELAENNQKPKQFLRQVKVGDNL